MTDEELILEAIHGNIAHAPISEQRAAADLVRRHNLTPTRAGYLMHWIRRQETWSAIVTAVKLEEHFTKISQQCDADRENELERPYAHKKTAYVDHSLQPDQMFLGMKSQDLIKFRDDLRGRIAAAKSRGLHGPKLFRDVLGADYKSIGSGMETTLKRVRAEVHAAVVDEEPGPADVSEFDLTAEIKRLHRERAEPTALADLTDAELNTFDAVANGWMEADSDLRQRWGMIPRIIAELLRRRVEALRIHDYGWQCGRCGEQQPILLMPAVSERCKCCGAPMCEPCRVHTGYCCDGCASG